MGMDFQRSNLDSKEKMDVIGLLRTYPKPSRPLGSNRPDDGYDTISCFCEPNLSHAKQRADNHNDDGHSISRHSNEEEAHSQSQTMPGFRCLVASLFITVAGVAVGLALYFFVFDEDEPQPTALCGSCHCIIGPDGTCPETAPKKPSSYGSDVVDQFAVQMPVNPFNLTCNPYEDPTCSTSPPQVLAELGEAAVRGLLYELAREEEECPH